MTGSIFRHRDASKPVRNPDILRPYCKRTSLHIEAFGREFDHAGTNLMSDSLASSGLHHPAGYAFWRVVPGDLR
jgi:hypothetical protein